jgi:hypothetical protein
VADLSSDAWRRAFVGDYAAGTARVPWSRDAASRAGSRGIRFDSYSSSEYRLEAVERGVAEAQNELRSVTGEIAGAKAEMNDLSRRVARLPGKGFLIIMLLVLLLVGAALVAFAPVLRGAIAGLL